MLLGVFKKRGPSIDAQGQAHYNRVIADGGVVPAGLLGCASFFTAIKAVYGASDITAVLSAAYDPHYLGFKYGAGSGITLGQAAQTLYSACGASGDLRQTTAGAQPLLLEHSGSNYFFGSGVVGNYCSTTQATANQITGDIDIRAYINTSSSKNQKCITGSGGGGNPNYLLTLRSDRKLEYWAFGGYGSFALSDTLPLGNTWVRCTRSGNTITFYTSTDSVGTNINSINWVQLGSPVTYTNTGTFVNSQLWVGNFPPYPNENSFQGAIYRVTISNSVGGSPVVDFNPASYNASASQTQWTSATGEVWTINTGTAATGYKGVLVDRTVVQGDGIDDTMKSSTITSRQYFTRYFSVNPLRIASGQYWIDGNATDRHLIYQSGGANSVALYNSGTGGGEIYATLQQFRTQLLTGDYNSTSSKLRSNAGADTTGTTGQNSSTAITVFSNGGQSGAFSNVVISTLIDAIAVSSNAEKTAMYNALKGFNNNAF